MPSSDARRKLAAIRSRLTGELDDDQKEAFEERAAIMEFDGGLSREDAEREAKKLIISVGD